MKKCAKCGTVKPLDQFHRNRGAAHGRHSWCKVCANAYYKARGPRRYAPAVRQRWNLTRRYGLTPEKVAAMLAAQGGRCAICREVPRRPCVDHDHSTGRVRGVLCHPCNIALGLVERPDFIEKAAAYLRRAR